MNKNAFLIIDAQFDFCNPKGALYVAGADKDTERLADIITKQGDKIDYICATLDTHHINDIAHPSFWQDANGNFPPPFTPITYEDIENGTWIPRFAPEIAKNYVQELENQGQFTHFIWTEHCIIGSKGASIEDVLLQALKNWARNYGKMYHTLQKGIYPYSEHFGIFKAQIPVENQPDTQLNQAFIQILSMYENVYLCGQAKSHCVATSLKQAMDFAPILAQKIIVLEDCMSDVPNLGHLGEPIYTEARQKGIRFMKSEGLVLD